MDLPKDLAKIIAYDIPDFDSVALEIFNFQYNSNAVYRDFADALKLRPGQVSSIYQIPFLPIRFFKSHEVKTTSFDPAIAFESSGTTGMVNSYHYIKDLALYERSFMMGMERIYGPINNYCVLGLLPSYLERSNSSLVYMVKELIQRSGNPLSGFYLNDYRKLFDKLSLLEKNGQKTILIGVTFGLLDFAERFPLALKNTIIMETGGMKGRREELVRQEVHERLKKAFEVANIHSEYGMTELLSQAWSKGDGIFHAPPWMKVMVRDDEDPLSVTSLQSTVNSRATESSKSVSGAINIIDLANIYSCSFIATDDAGRLYPDGSFEVLGRIDNSDIRGCSLMTL